MYSKSQDEGKNMLLYLNMEMLLGMFQNPGVILSIISSAMMAMWVSMKLLVQEKIEEWD